MWLILDRKSEKALFAPALKIDTRRKFKLAMDKTLDGLKAAFGRLRSLRPETNNTGHTSALAQFIAPLTKLLLAPPGATADALQVAGAALGEAADIELIEILRFSERNVLELDLIWAPEDIRMIAAASVPTITSADLALCEQLSRTTLYDDVQQMDEKCCLKQHLTQLRTKSVLVVPLPGVETTSGLVIFASLARQRDFADEEVLILQVISSLIGSLLIRRDTERMVAVAQSELHAEKARLQGTLGALPDLVVELDNSGRMTSFYSQTMASLVEKPERHIGASPEEVLPKRVANAIRSVLQEVDNTGSSEGKRFHLRLTDQRHWFSVSGSRLHDLHGDGEPGYLLVIRDRTAEHHRTQELRRLSDIVKRTSNMIVVTDADRRIDWVNKSFETHTGYKLEEIKGLNPGKLLHGPETDKNSIAAMSTALNEERGIELEILNYTKDGKPFWLEMDIQPYHDEAGNLSGFMAIQSDVTERRKLISELKKAEKKARADQAVAMDASRDGIAITDSDGNFVYMNQAHMEMFAIAQEEDILGQNWSRLYTPERAAMINQFAFPQLLDTGGWKGEIAGCRFDGTTIEQEVSLTLKDDGGIVCITRDIGDRLRAQYERSRLRDELQIAQRREIIGQMAAGLAHDFNNLIASISGSASLILGSSDQQIIGHAERIQLAATKATELVRRMQDVGARTPSRRRIELNAALHEVADLVQSGLSSEITITIPDDLSELYLDADPTDFLQVILNLAINSRDALQLCRREHPEVIISMDQVSGGHISKDASVGRVYDDLDYVRVSVCDNGPGIPSDIRDKVFQPYFTTKGSRGSGLGLTVVASIVEAYDGVIQISNNEIDGNRIDVLWPTSPPVSAQLPTSLKGCKLTGRLDGKAILLVDDSEELLRVLSIFLERAGAEVCVSSNPIDTLEAIKSAPEDWDLLITDFDMPLMNGSDLARETKRINPELPIVLITALPDWRGRAGRSSGRDFLAVLGKPVQASELVETAEIAIQSGSNAKPQVSQNDA